MKKLTAISVLLLLVSCSPSGVLSASSSVEDLIASVTINQIAILQQSQLLIDMMNMTSKAFATLCPAADRSARIAENLIKECPEPFKNIGDRCLFVNNLKSGSWHEMRSYCRTLRGDLVKMDDANLMRDTIDYLHALGLDQNSYWVGATDEGHEGRWVWTDGSVARLGTPFWALRGGSCTGQEPDNYRNNQHCAYLWKSRRFFFDDADCSARISPICEVAVPVAI